jgi:hypothetical protein
MIHRGLIGGLAVAVAAALLQATPVRADVVVGTQAIVDTDTPTANTGDITTATSFTLTALTTTGSRTGDFLAVPPLTALFPPTAILTLATPSTFHFGSTAFGTFTGISIVTLASAPGFESFRITGLFAPGTLFPATKQTPSVTTLDLGFTQIGGPNTAISASGTLVAVPEPGSLLLGVAGVAGVGLVTGLRRRFRAAA